MALIDQNIELIKRVPKTSRWEPAGSEFAYNANELDDAPANPQGLFGNFKGAGTYLWDHNIIDLQFGGGGVGALQRPSFGGGAPKPPEKSPNQRTQQDIAMGMPIYFFCNIVKELKAGTYKLYLENTDENGNDGWTNANKVSQIFDGGITLNAGDGPTSKRNPVIRFIPYGTEKRFLRCRLVTTGAQSEGEIEAYVTPLPPAPRPEKTIFYGNI